MLVDVLQDWGAVEVTALDVYSRMFKIGQGYIQAVNEPAGQYKANPLGYYKDDVNEPGHYRILFEDTFAEVLEELQSAKGFAILNGITYFGRRNVADHASKMYAMIFDLDGVTDDSLVAFLSGASSKVGVYPEPNYIILSGHGIHLYYFFDEPLELFPYIKLQLKDLKYELTRKMWNRYTSTIDKPQVQGINQGFRVIGSRTKSDALEPVARAFSYREDAYTLDELCQYVDEEHRVNQQRLWRESRYTLDEAKVKFPEWYQKVVVEKNHERTSYWQISEKVHGDNPYALYDWWLRKIKSGATYGHRYFAIMCLAIYAIKCQVPYDRLEKDALDLVPFLHGLNPSKPFCVKDVKSALECYDLRYSTFPIKDIVELSQIPIKENDRNYRTRYEHLWADYWYLKNGRRKKNPCKENRQTTLEDMRAAGEIPGRPNKENIVREWRKEHLDGRKIDCHRDTGLSRVTIDKWW